MKVDKDGFHIPAWPMACPPVHPQADVLRYVIILNRIVSVPSLIVVNFLALIVQILMMPFISHSSSSLHLQVLRWEIHI